ncbi:hypothetical protein LTR09_005854 [Extremus antarcticus]|uniref:Serine-threonine protein kinase 19 n=1 Tax=Extremus antarcticus TaxID=702011 RepID=A0AAJ0DMJ4_9PEZI|nr:hypothetical protein LTR09_005854 [Extremus antarcticus]
MPKTPSPFARKREAPSPLKALRRSSSSKSGGAQATATEDKLDDTGLVPSLAPRGVAQDAAGMGSERIGEVLRFRQNLPRIVSVAHIHALSASSTETERELARLIARGAVRKVIVPGRGKGGAAVGEGVVLAEDWKTNVRESRNLDEELKDKCLALMDAHPNSSVAPTTSLSNDEVRSLVQAGYLISTSALSSNINDSFARPGLSSLSTLSQSGFKSATGTLAAVGGTDAIHSSGGGGSTLATSASRPAPGTKFQHNMQTMTFSLPSTGAYLKLLTSARLHLLALLKQLSPRHKEATIEMLREKWDGNILNDATSRAKRARGEWGGVMPGKTRKWREFWGLEFRWVLEECVGGGLVEVFETGSVGLAVRAS